MLARLAIFLSLVLFYWLLWLYFTCVLARLVIFSVLFFFYWPFWRFLPVLARLAIVFSSFSFIGYYGYIFPCWLDWLLLFFYRLLLLAIMAISYHLNDKRDHGNSDNSGNSNRAVIS